MTGAAKDCCDTVRKRQQKIEQRNRPRLHHTIMYHLRISVKCRDQRRSRHIDQNTDQFRDHYGAQDAKPRTFFRTVVLLRTKILADKGCQRHRKACNRKKRKSLNL